jgi:hypothetical protein
VYAFGKNNYLYPVNFEEYLSGKKIDSVAFKAAEADRWKEWESEFAQLHPDSFTLQKLYLINPIRRKYPLQSPQQK